MILIRILVLSDIHSSNHVVKMANKDIEALSPELLIICGDITHFGPPSFAESFIGSFNLRTLAIPGNCDPPDVLKVLERKGVNLHQRNVNIGGFDFVGFGGSNRTPFRTPMEFDEDDIFNALDPIMVRGAVLITHVPPRGYVDTSIGGQHFGSEAVAKIVKKYKPMAVISGHIHEARGVVREKGIVYLNPGPAMRGNRAILHLHEESIEVDLLG